MKSLKIYFLTWFFAALPLASFGALPPQFSECFYQNSGTAMSPADITEIARISRVTYCQNQVGLITKADAISMLKTPNVQVGVSLSKTTYSFADLMDMAAAGTYVLYVDGPRLSRDNLIALAGAGVQLVIVSSVSGMSKPDLLAIAAQKSFIYNVNSAVARTDLIDYLKAGIQIVIRSSQSALTRADILEVAAVNSELVTIMP